MSDCDLCGLDDSECRCYVNELADRIEALEEGLDALTKIVEAIHQYIMKEEDEDVRRM